MAFSPSDILQIYSIGKVTDNHHVSGLISVTEISSEDMGPSSEKKNRANILIPEAVQEGEFGEGYRHRSSDTKNKTTGVLRKDAG